MKKNKIRKILIFFIFLLGISILLYPIVSKLISIKNQTIVISNYDETVNNMEESEKENLEKENKTYNDNLYNNKFNYKNTLENVNEADFYPKGKILSYIIIPKINVNIPIYEGSSNFVLEKGIGHLENTSLPIGGISTHSVLVGHSGLVTANLFNSLDKLAVNDEFYIKNLEIFLKYRVISVDTVKPTEIEKLEIKENQDLVTLVTCTPKYINTHRLLVTGVRDELTQEDEQRIENTIEEIKNQNIIVEKILKKENLLVLFIIPIIIIIIFYVLKYWNGKKK